MSVQVSEAELVLLKILWGTKNPVTSNYIMSKLPENVDWKRTTVLTMLSRMIEKQSVTAEKRGKSFYYSPNIREEKYKKLQTRSFIDRVHNGRISSLVASLCCDEPFSESELRELRRILEGGKSDV